MMENNDPGLILCQNELKITHVQGKYKKIQYLDSLLMNMHGQTGVSIVHIIKTKHEFISGLMQTNVDKVLQQEKE